MLAYIGANLLDILVLIGIGQILFGDIAGKQRGLVGQQKEELSHRPFLQASSPW